MTPQVDPNHFMGTMSTLGWILAIVLNVSTLAMMWTGRKAAQKREVSFSEPAVNASICELKHKAIDAQLEELKECISLLRQEMVAENGKLHRRVDELIVVVSRIEGILRPRRQS